MADRSTKYRPKPRAWYRSPWVAALVVVGFVTIVAVILVIPVWATDTPTYCMSCKATKVAGAEWKHSSHSNVSCTACHVPPGLGNAIKWRSREWLNVWADYLNVPRSPSIGQRPGNANCLKCHTLKHIPDHIDLPDQGSIRMPHQVHVNLRNLSCADCHDKVAHPKPGEKTTVSMAVCSMCHSTEGGAPSDCSFCHLTPPPTDVHPKDYVQTHGRQALINEQACLRCHHNKVQFCDACHAKPPPDHFSGTWRYTHAATAKKDPLSCTGCHDAKTFCAQCHLVNHPGDWVTTHGPIAARSGGACLVCHPQAMCDACHKQRGVTP